MTPLISIRSFTNDQYTLDKVFYANWYSLRGFKGETNRPTVVDIGAHAGYFAFASLALGAKKVFTFEPFADNFTMLVNNLRDHRMGESINYQMGVYVADTTLTFGYPEIKKDSFFDFANIGQNNNLDSSKVAACHCVTLDTALKNYIAEPVDILKINIGYAEMSVLLESTLLGSQVQHVCGETELNDATRPTFQAKMASKGFIEANFTPVPETENRMLFHFSRSKLSDAFELKV